MSCDMWIDGNFYLVDRDLGCSITASSVKIQSFAGAVFRKRTGAAGSRKLHLTAQVL